MKSYLVFLLLFTLVATACAPASPPTASLTSSPDPSPTSAPVQDPGATPDSGATPTTQISEGEGQPVTFDTPDGVKLEGTLYGDGPVAVIFSHMSDARQETWAEMAQAISNRGYLALTFNFRFWVNGGIQDNLRDKAAEDLKAATMPIARKAFTRLP